VPIEKRRRAEAGEGSESGRDQGECRGPEGKLINVEGRRGGSETTDRPTLGGVTLAAKKPNDGDVRKQKGGDHLTSSRIEKVRLP